MAEQMQDEDYDFDPEPRAQNPWLSRTLGREMFYLGVDPRTKGSLKDRLNGNPRCFVIRRTNVYAGVEFWMQVGMRADMTLIGVPFYSGASIKNWTYLDKNKNVRIGMKYPPKDDALADLVKQHPELIVPKTYKGKTELWTDGSPKRNYDLVYAVEAYELLFEMVEIDDPKNPGKKINQYVKGANGQAKYTINPTPYILKLRRPWYMMLKDRVLKPKEEEEIAAPAASDPDGAVQKPQKKKWSGKLPTTDITSIMLKLFARTGDEPAKGDANVEYDIQFSETIQVDSKTFAPVDPLPTKSDGKVDWEKIFPPMTANQAMDIVAKAGETSDHDGGDQPPPPPPPDHEHAAGGTDDDIPF